MPETSTTLADNLELMLQASRNIQATASAIATPQAFDRDAVDNIYMCMTIMLESYMNIPSDQRPRFSSINWDEVIRFLHILKMDFEQIDKTKLWLASRNQLFSLLTKLEKVKAELQA